MRKLFILVTSTIYGLLLSGNILLADEFHDDPLGYAIDRKSAGIWISDNWIKNQKEIHIVGVYWEREVQPNLKKPWNEYKNVNIAFYPARKPGKKLQMQGSVNICGENCIVDGNIVYYTKYEEESEKLWRKYIFTPDGKMIYNGVTYSLVPFDQFDAFYEQHIAPRAVHQQCLL